MEMMLKEIVDLHACFKDVEELFQIIKCLEEGYLKAVILKSENFPTSMLAKTLEKLLGKEVYGSLVLNESVGGFNLRAVERALGEGIKAIWMPTIDAWNYRKYLGLSGGYTIFTTRGEIRIEVEHILSQAAENNVIVMTGHLSPGESEILCEMAREIGVKKLVLSHVLWPPTYFTIKKLKELVRDGVYIELPLAMLNSIKAEDYVKLIREVGIEHCLVTIGNEEKGSKYLDIIKEGFKKLLDAGLSLEELRKLAYDGPLSLLHS